MISQFVDKAIAYNPGGHGKRWRLYLACGHETTSKRRLRTAVCRDCQENASWLLSARSKETGLPRVSRWRDFLLALTLQAGFEEWRRLNDRPADCCDNPSCRRWQQERNSYLQQVMFGGPLPSAEVPV